MPTYDYVCATCGHTQEEFQKITDSPLTTCESCQKETLKRRPGRGAGLLFTGSGDGFYTHMYGSKSAEGAPAASGGCCPCGKNSGACKSS